LARAGDASLGEEHWPTVAVALYAGFRRSNCFRLQWADDVNFDSGSLRAHQPKDGADYHVLMNADLRAILRALPSRLRSPWVFPSDTGDTPLDSQNFITASSDRLCRVPVSPTSRGTISATRSPRGSRWRASIFARSRSCSDTGRWR
jgi:hypothetical protein